VKLKVNAYIKRASLYIQTEKCEKGLQDLYEAEKLDPENADVYYQRAQAYLVLGQILKAFKELEKVLKYAPDHAMAYVQKFFIQYPVPFFAEKQKLQSRDQQRFDRADLFFEKAIQMFPENAAELYVHRGVLHKQFKGDIEKAVNLINKAIEIDDKSAYAYKTLQIIEFELRGTNV